MSDTGTDTDACASAPAAEPGFLAETRAAYDTVAESYAELLADHLAGQPHERAMMALYAELLHERAGGGSNPRVTEVGCGPGRITAHLATLGLEVSGIDLSPGMIAEARRRHPGIGFEVGSMTALDLPEGGLDGLVAWYSVIHVPPAGHRALYAGFRRALAVGGLLLVGFHAGDERRAITEAYGHSGLRLDAYRLVPDRVEEDLAAAGFAHVARMTRAPIGPEKTPQAYIIARAA